MGTSALKKDVFNLGLRFFLELAAWAGPAYWASLSFEGPQKYLFSFLVPLALIAIWGVFAVANDPSRSGKTVIPTNGKIRILLEIAEFSLGALAWYKSGLEVFSYLIIGLLILHHLLQIERLKWLWNLNNSEI